jgi:hypothetical protein
LNGLINHSVITWNGNVSVDDGSLTSSVTSLVRQTGENVGSYNITSGIFAAASGNYNSPTLNGTPNLAINQASLTASIANQSKIYGANDPSVSGIGVTLNGLINRSVSTWNGNVNVNDSSLTSSVTSLVRNSGENVGNYNITNGIFTAASDNYSAPTLNGTPTLNINAANLTGTIANQSKTYGADDPSLSGISVNLGGVINRTISTWNGNVIKNDTGNVATTLASLTRDSGETVGSYNITAGTFNALTGSAAGNYNAPSFTGSSALTINAANLTGSISNQSKIYGANDPSISGISVTLGGRVNTSVTNWMGSATVINDTTKVNGTLTALSRDAGETVTNSPYAINSATFALSGSSAGNYNSIVPFIGAPTLTITSANLTGAIANQNKIYGTNDPTLSGINVALTGVINRTVSTWDGNVVIDDTGNVATTLASLTRNPGENVGNYNITAGAFNTLTGSASGNYNAPSFTGSPNLAINQATVTTTANPISIVYGTSSPPLTDTEIGLVNATVTNWMGNTTNINDQFSGALARVAGQNVGSYPILIGTLTAGSNYTMNFISANFSITPATLISLNVIANSKLYNGATNTTLNLNTATLSGILFNDQVSIDPTGYSANFATSNVGNNLLVIVSNLGLMGASANNYTLMQPEGLTADILSTGTSPTPIPTVPPSMLPQIASPETTINNTSVTPYIPATLEISPELLQSVSEGRSCTKVSENIQVCS